MNGIYPQYTGPTEQYRLASLYPVWTGGFLFEQVPELAAANDGTLRPFKRVAVTPHVMAQIQADWSTHFPIVDVERLSIPPVLVPKQPATPIADVPTQRPGNVVPLTRDVIIALPQFATLVRGKTAKPIAGVSVEMSVGDVLVEGRANAPLAAATPSTVDAQVHAYRTVLLPDTVRNLTDEQLVAIAMGIL